MNTYTYYTLPNGAIVGVCQPEQRYTHIGDLLTIHTYVRVVGRRYDGTIGEFGIHPTALENAVEIAPTTAARFEPGVVRYIESRRRRQAQMSRGEPKANQRSMAAGAKVPA